MIVRKKNVLCVVASLAAVGLVFAACGGDDAAVNGSDASTGDSTTGDDGATSGDSAQSSDSATNDGGDITDGGSNFGDASLNDAGDLPDGGTCNMVDVGATIMSDCSSIIPNTAGGAIVAGTYTLTKVTDLGSKLFCASTFVAVPFEGGAVLAAAATAGSDSAMIALNPDNKGRRSFNWTITPATGNKSPLTVDELCPATTTTVKPYASFVNGAGKQVFEYVGEYGTSGGRALYHYEKN